MLVHTTKEEKDILISEKGTSEIMLSRWIIDLQISPTWFVKMVTTCLDETVSHNSNPKEVIMGIFGLGMCLFFSFLFLALLSY